MTGKKACLGSLRLYLIIITGPQVDPGFRAMIVMVRVQLEFERIFDRLRSRINIELQLSSLLGTA